ncbi:MAG: hypothetical protein M1820_008779 [Bogoriella megaspora]|nr:MAG: hypothetical protein M1820_008779 [Bogoriella megaspora]
MPRSGTGASDNVVEAGQDLVHNNEGKQGPASSGVDRSHKAAPPPDAEAGDALKEIPASGGGSSGAHIGNTGQGGNKEAFVDKEADRLEKST